MMRLQHLAGFARKLCSGLVTALISLSAVAASASENAPKLCDMVRAFDSALQLRYYRANLAPDRLDCRFYEAEGCPYSLRRQVVIRITHLEPMGCAADGATCAFRARQTCSLGKNRGDCYAIMAQPISDYIVAGRFEKSGDHWRLSDWTREPTTPLMQDAVVSSVCPEITKDSI